MNSMIKFPSAKTSNGINVTWVHMARGEAQKPNAYQVLFRDNQGPREIYWNWNIFQLEISLGH